MSAVDGDREMLQRGLEILGERARALPAAPPQVTGDPLTEDARNAAIHCIELIVLRLIRQLAANDAVELCIPRDVAWTDPPVRTPDHDPDAAADAASTPAVRVRFGARASQRKFAVVTMLLSRAHKLLSTRTMGTRRQLYYEEVAFLRSQREVDAGVLDVSRLVGLPPWQLGLLATAKGLVAGDLTLVTADGDVLDCRNAPGGVLIPGDVTSVVAMHSSARFVLVLEKDTLFQRVLREGALDRLGPCVIVTAKGYPDVATRVLLARLDAQLRVPMLAVVDADPHGVHIMCVYRFGTKTCPVALPSLRWLGLLPSEAAALAVRGVALTPRDVALARALLLKPYLPPAVRFEVETMLQLGVKAEVDALLAFAPSYITDVYLSNKIAAAHAF